MSILVKTQGANDRTGVADACVMDFYADFVRFWGPDLDILNGKVFASFPSYGGLVVINSLSLWPDQGRYTVLCR